MELIGKIFGGGDDAAQLAAASAAADQRRQLATLAQQQAGLDQAKATGGRVQGRKLLTFLGQGSGDETIG